MQIRGFRGWRFAGAGGDVSGHLAPPYDILSAEQKQALLDGCPQNIVAIDLPHVPPKQAGPDEVYAAAAKLLAQWQGDGVLAQDDAPAIYVYDQSYTWAGQAYTRRTILTGVRATPLGADQDVIPHEHTFAGPKADRLKLTQATRTQLSPIFGFYHDRSGKVADILAEQTARKPDAFGELAGVSEKLWVVCDPAVIERIAAALADVPAFIADGHHRYTTALNYRDELKAAGEIDDEHEANFVLFALVERDSEGLLVLPTHRLVTGLAESFSLDKLRETIPGYAWRRVASAGVDLSDADAFLAPFGPSAMAFVAGDGAEMWIGRLTAPQAMVAAAPDQCDAWRKLDVAILQTLIMDGALAAFKTDATEVTYTPDGNEALSAVRSGAVQFAVIMQGTPAAAVEAVALAGEVMPHKSTYFYPKLSTGMVLKPLE